MSFFQRHPGATIFLTVVLVLGFVDFATANLYRLLTGYSWADRVVKRTQISERVFREASPVYHHGLRPNVSFAGARWGDRVYPIATNSLGFKCDSPHEVPLRSSKRRILFIGDSLTEGIGVAYKDTFVGLVSERLASENIEVFNAAAASYSPIIYWRKVKHLIDDVGFRFDELVVFIDLSDAWDEVNRYRLSESGNVVDRDILEDDPITLKSIFRHNSILFLNLVKVVRNWWAPQLAGSQTGNPKALWTLDDNLYEQFGRAGQSMMRTYMDRLLELLGAHNIKLTVAVYPWPDQIMRGDLHSRQVSFWREWESANEVPFLNYFPNFVKPESPMAERKKMLTRYFIEGDVHWNEAGHRLIAEGFLKHYKSSKRFPN